MNLLRRGERGSPREGLQGWWQLGGGAGGRAPGRRRSFQKIWKGNEKITIFENLRRNFAILQNILKIHRIFGETVGKI